MKSNMFVKIFIGIILFLFLIAGIGYVAKEKGLFEMKHADQENTSKDTNIISESKEFDAFENINIEASVNNIEIVSSNKYKVELKYDETYGKIDYKVENDTLKIAQNPYKKSMNIIVNNYIKIYVPKDVKVKNLNISLEVGNITLENLDINKSTFKSKVGNMEIKQCLVNEVDASVDKGNIDINESTINKNLKLKSDVGNSNLNGKFLGHINISENVGDIKLNIDENENLYNYKGSTNTGNLIINGKERGKVLDVYNNAQNNIELECRTGDITLDFKK